VFGENLEITDQPLHNLLLLNLLNTVEYFMFCSLQKSINIGKVIISFFGDFKIHKLYIFTRNNNNSHGIKKAKKTVFSIYLQILLRNFISCSTLSSLW
jgi:hypothetical protein